MAMSVSAPSIDPAVDALKQLLGPRANDSATVREHHSQRLNDRLVMRAIKRALDPDNRMNPGKMI